MDRNLFDKDEIMDIEQLFHENVSYFPVRQALKKRCFYGLKAHILTSKKRVFYHGNRVNALKCTLLTRKNVVFFNDCLTWLFKFVNILYITY